MYAPPEAPPAPVPPTAVPPSPVPPAWSEAPKTPRPATQFEMPASYATPAPATATPYKQAETPPPQVPVAPRKPAAALFGRPLGLALAGVGVLVLLVAGWLVMRPKPRVGGGQTPQTASAGSTPLEQHLSQPSGGTLLSKEGPAPPKVVSFRPNLASVTPGGTIHLVWSVSGASEVIISPGIGTVRAEGSADVPMRKTTEFTLIAKNQKGEPASSSTTVIVAQAPPPEPHPGTTPVKTPPAPQTPQPQRPP